MGSFEIPLLRIVRAAECLKQKTPYMPGPLSKNKGLTRAATLWGFVDKQYGGSGEVARMDFFLTVARSLDKSEPRDVVYGMLGLSNWNQDLPEVASLLTPGHSKALPGIIRDATRFGIWESCFRPRTDFLRILCWVDHLRFKGSGNRNLWSTVMGPTLG